MSSGSYLAAKQPTAGCWFFLQPAALPALVDVTVLLEHQRPFLICWISGRVATVDTVYRCYLKFTTSIHHNAGAFDRLLCRCCCATALPGLKQRVRRWHCSETVVGLRDHLYCRLEQIDLRDGAPVVELDDQAQL